MKLLLYRSAHSNNKNNCTVAIDLGTVALGLSQKGCYEDPGGFLATALVIVVSITTLSLLASMIGVHWVKLPFDNRPWLTCNWMIKFWPFHLHMDSYLSFSRRA